MSFQTPIKLSCNGSPNLDYFHKYSKALNEYNDSWDEDKGICRDGMNASKLAPIEYKGLLKDVQDSAKNIVYLTTIKIAQDLGLDVSFMNYMPAIDIFDEMRYRELKARISADPFESINYWPEQHALSFFQRGSRFYSHPPGPVMSIPSSEVLNWSGFVEESLHFLQYYHESFNLQEPLRYYNDGEKPKMTIEQKLASLISHECSAEFVRSLYFFNSKKDKKSKRVKKRNKKDEVFTSCLKVLLEKDLESSYFEFLKGEEVHNFEELMKKRPLFDLNDLFISDYVHFLGYGLGKKLYSVCFNKKSLKFITKVMFLPTEDHQKKIDLYAKLYRTLKDSTKNLPENILLPLNQIK